MYYIEVITNRNGINSYIYAVENLILYVRNNFKLFRTKLPYDNIVTD